MMLPSSQMSPLPLPPTAAVPMKCQTAELGVLRLSGLRCGCPMAAGSGPAHPQTDRRTDGGASPGQAAHSFLLLLCLRRFPPALLHLALTSQLCPEKPFACLQMTDSCPPVLHYAMLSCQGVMWFSCCILWAPLPSNASLIPGKGLVGAPSITLLLAASHAKLSSPTRVRNIGVLLLMRHAA